MRRLRFWPAAVAAVIATSAAAFAAPTPISISGDGRLPPIKHPIVSRTVTHRSPTTVVPIRRAVPVTVVPRALPPRTDDRSDDQLLRRIDRIHDESCAMAMRDRPDFDGAILAGIIEQRQDQCMHRFRNDDRRDDRQINGFNNDRFDDRRLEALRRDDRRDDRRVPMVTDNVRDDRQLRTLRIDDRRDDRHPMSLDNRRDDRRLQLLRTDDRRDDRGLFVNRAGAFGRPSGADRGFVSRNFRSGGAFRTGGSHRPPH